MINSNWIELIREINKDKLNGETLYYLEGFNEISVTPVIVSDIRLTNNNDSVICVNGDTKMLIPANKLFKTTKDITNHVSDLIEEQRSIAEHNRNRIEDLKEDIIEVESKIKKYLQYAIDNEQLLKELNYDK